MKERRFGKLTDPQRDVLTKLKKGYGLLYNIGEIAMVFTPSGKRMLRPSPNVRTVDNLFCRGAIDRIRGRFRKYEITEEGRKLLARKD